MGGEDELRDQVQDAVEDIAEAVTGSVGPPGAAGALEDAHDADELQPMDELYIEEPDTTSVPPTEPTPH